MTDQFALVPAVYVMFRRSNPAQRPEVLLQLREGTGFMDGYWAHAAAGHVELGESALDAAVREAAEELGVELLSSELKPLTVLHRRHAEGFDPVDHRVDFFYECRAWSGEPRRMEPLKSADLRWWPVDELPEKLVDHERFVIEAHHAGQLAPIHSYGF
ncbi:MAG: hypothetical protein K0Q46_1842 [Rhodococcus erythropolis]|uniref:NUDIX domain-containing protein n=1 Tax=Rhodococcus erythropolis TaxID=1833 RepID=UPI00114E1B61|nr:NUDIX domain-containing protein [Rhodococcus erythropolis]MBF7737494.1 NUDIX domain-containing protein [Rhodococcus erythropolis]MCZ4644984.1 NUDIX domain-containing protein [Rhodococcus erythropolis]MDF2895056.1 hypothetical protein [Rhodococcus erythropolis]